MVAYNGPDRRTKTQLTDEEIEEIAERAAKRAFEEVSKAAYQEFGRKAVGFTAWVMGTGAMAFLGYLFANHKIP